MADCFCFTSILHKAPLRTVTLIVDFLTVTMKIIKKETQEIVTVIEENVVLIQNYASATTDPKTQLPKIDLQKKERGGTKVIGMAEVVAAVNFASIYSVSLKDRHKDN